MNLNWRERFQILKEEADRTNDFAHNLYVRQLNKKLEEACKDKNKVLARNLMVEMGF